MSEKHYLDQHGLAHLWEKIKALQGKAEIHTSAEWASMPQVVSEAGKIYVYSDHQIVDGVAVPGIKIGDGTAHVVSLPFIDIVYQNHIDNVAIHVSDADRIFWNNKVRCYASTTQNETIVFTSN